MNDPSEYSNVGENFVLDEKERQTRLSNETIEHIESSEAVAEEATELFDLQTTQPATAGVTQPVESIPTPSTEGPYRDAEGNIDLEQIRKEGAELDAAAITGLADTAIDFANFILPDFIPDIPKATKYENNVASAVRSISSVVLPTLGLQSLGMSAAATLQSRAISKFGAGAKINQLGNTAFMKFVGSRGVEAGASVAVGAVASEYEEDNMLGAVKKALPPQWDFIPDNWATLEGDSPDIKRQKNINEDLAMGFLIPFASFAGKFTSGWSECFTGSQPSRIREDTFMLSASLTNEVLIQRYAHPSS